MGVPTCQLPTWDCPRSIGSAPRYPAKLHTRPAAALRASPSRGHMARVPGLGGRSREDPGEADKPNAKAQATSIHSYIHVYIYVYTYRYRHMYIYIYIYMYVSLSYVYVNDCLYTYIYIYVYTCICMCMYILITLDVPNMEISGSRHMPISCALGSGILTGRRGCCPSRPWVEDPLEGNSEVQQM